MKTYQEFITEAGLRTPSLGSGSLNKPNPAVQNAQKSIVKRPVPATQPANNNTATAAAAGTTPVRSTGTATPTATATAGTKRPSLMQQAQELRAMRMRSMQRQGNTAGASAIRKTLPTAVAGASDQRAQQLNRVRNQARSATIANARGGQGMMKRSPVVQQQRPVPTARPVVQQQQRPVPTARPVVQQQQRPVVQQQRPVPTEKPVVQQQQRPAAAAGTTQKPVVQQQSKFRDEDLFTGQKLNPNTGKPVQQQSKFRDEDLFTGQPLNQTTGKPIQQQSKFRDEDLFTGQKLNPNTGKPIQQQNNGRVVNDAGVTRVTDPSTSEINVIKRRSPEEQQRIKSALDISGGTTQAPSSSSNSQLSDDMIKKAFAAQKRTMMRGDGGEYSSDVWGDTPDKFRATFNSLPPNRQRAILRRLSQ